MKLIEFKKLLGAYVPDRISDAYLERLFYAFCCTSSYTDQLTFKVKFLKICNIKIKL